MPELLPLRIIHISDLHFTSSSAPSAHLEEKVKVPGLSKNLKDSPEEVFLKDLESMFQKKKEPEDKWPKAVIVTGDIVDKGGTDKGTDGHGEFDKAVKFLNDLAIVLKISKDRILVLPGNHDVDWSPGLSQLERFKNYITATEEFSSPTITNNKLNPHHSDLSTIREGVSLELMLFVSPTFSGVSDPSNESFIARIKDILKDMDEDVRAKIEESLRASQGSLDIATLGRHQRHELRLPIDQDPEQKIRIAALHHHLLPDPQIEVAQFESVLDAGKVLESLINDQYDLVLSGHKHNRRLVQYRYMDKVLDIYTAPSLFKGNQPGFTIIDLFGPNNPHYAVLNYYHTAGCTLFGKVPLVRRGRVLPEVSQMCASIPPQEQQTFLIPILKSLEATSGWTREQSFPKNLFNMVWDQTLKDIDKIGKQRLVFRPPFLWQQWEKLIDLVNQRGEDFYGVSEDDFEYWKASVVPNTEPFKYISALKKIKKKKSRIMILGNHVFQYPDAQKDAIEVIEGMLGNGFRVVVVLKDTLPRDVARDFGIMGSLARYSFDGSKDFIRSLEQSFNKEDINKAHHDWEILLDNLAWDSEGEADPITSFKRWLEHKSDVKKPE
jgi:3',5'-cyclic AMP phosphodiesterase CpdA